MKVKYYYFFLLVLLSSISYSQDLAIEVGKKSKVKGGRGAGVFQNFFEYEGDLVFVRAGNRIMAIDKYNKDELTLVKSIMLSYPISKALQYQSSLLVNNTIIVFASERKNNSDRKKGIDNKVNQVWVSIINLENLRQEDWKKVDDFYCSKDTENRDHFSDDYFVLDKKMFYDSLNGLIVTFDIQNHDFKVFDKNVNANEKFTNLLNKKDNRSLIPLDVITSNIGSNWILYSNIEPYADLAPALPTINKNDFYYVIQSLNRRNDSSYFNEVKMAIHKDIDFEGGFIDGSLISFKIIDDKILYCSGLYNNESKHIGSFIAMYDINTGVFIKGKANKFPDVLSKALQNSGLINVNERSFYSPLNYRISSEKQSILSTYGKLGVKREKRVSNFTTNFLEDGIGCLVKREPINSNDNILLSYQHFNRKVFLYETFLIGKSSVNSNTNQYQRTIVMSDTLGLVLSIKYDTSCNLLWNNVLNKTQAYSGMSFYDNFDGFVPYSYKSSCYLIFNANKDCFDYKCWDVYKDYIIRNAQLGYYKIDQDTVTRKALVDLKREFKAAPIISKYAYSGDEIFLLVTNLRRKKYRLIRIYPKDI